MPVRILLAAFASMVLTACASPMDRQWRDLQTILEHQERSR